MKKIKNILLSAIAAMIWSAGGCASADILSESDITVEVLEAKMAEKVDPAGRYRKSKSFAFRQQVKIPQFLDEDILNMVETKMVMPDKFCITTFKDNEPVQIICSNGDRGWIANVSAKKLISLDGEKLEQLHTFSKLATPAAGYRKIFDKVEIYRCSNDDGEFYLLVCSGKKGNTFRIYVDADDFMLRRMTGKVKVGSGYLDYDSRILNYGRYHGVMIPRVTETVQNGQKQIIELLSYELNPDIPAGDFAPPIY